MRLPYVLLALAVGLAAARAGAQESAAPPGLPPPSHAEIDDSLEIAGDPLRARVTNSRMTIATFVNGQGPFRFLVDTGADRSVIGADLARRLGLAINGAARLNHVGGQTLVGTVTIDSLRAGSNEVAGIDAPALPEEFLGAQGILGIDALREQRIAMDFDSRTITIQNPRLPDRAAMFAGEVVVTGRRRKGQLILTALQLDHLTFDAVIDTGAEVTMGNSVLLAKLFANRPVPPGVPADITTVTGQVIKARLIVVPQIRIASLVVKNVPIAFYDAAPFALFGLANRPALLLGNDVLESFRRVTLDFRRRKVRFLLRQ